MKVVYYILGVIKLAVIDIISVLIVISSSPFNAIFQTIADLLKVQNILQFLFVLILNNY